MLLQVPHDIDQEIMNEYIWNNKQIFIENSTVYSKDLLKIYDINLLSLTENFMTVEELLVHLHRGFVLLIKLYWRSAVTVEGTFKVYIKRNLIESDEAQLLIDAEFTKLTQKAVYSELHVVSKIASIPTAQNRFCAV